MSAVEFNLILIVVGVGFLKPNISTMVGGLYKVGDNKRDTGNPSDNRLYPSQNAAEATSTNYHIDFLSNGFKIRSSHVAFNNNGDDVIYIAFAENPFVNSNGTPGTAK